MVGVQSTISRTFTNSDILIPIWFPDYNSNWFQHPRVERRSIHSPLKLSYFRWIWFEFQPLLLNLEPLLESVILKLKLIMSPWPFILQRSFLKIRTPSRVGGVPPLFLIFIFFHIFGKVIKRKFLSFGMKQSMGEGKLITRNIEL